MNSIVLFFQEIVGEVLKRSGVSVALTAICNVAAFLCAYIIPIPALRAFSLQAAILSTFNGLSMILLYPALLGLDLRRVSAGKMDLLCCYNGKNGRKSIDEKDSEKAKSAPEAQHAIKGQNSGIVDQQQMKVVDKWTLKGKYNKSTAQCRNLIIFLSLRFYVKSKLAWRI